MLWLEKYRTWFSLLLLVLGAGWIFLSRLEAGAAVQSQSAPQEHFFAPDFTLETLEGASMTLSDLRGRPVLVNLWATWCPPCQEEMPALEEVYREYQERGFLVLAVNATAQERSPSAPAEFAKQYGLTFPILLDQSNLVIDQYQVRAFPASYFITPDGRIQEVVLGGPMSEALLRIRVIELFQNTGAETP